jgi:uncharacterized membrane protein YjfL (UPF0719 family)
MDMEFAKASSIMLGINLLYAVLGLVLAVASVKAIDHFFLRKLDLEEEIHKGNIAAAIFASALTLGAMLVVAVVLSK